MKVNYRHKKLLLDDLYNKFEEIINQKVILEMPLEINKDKEVISFCDRYSNGSLRVSMDHNNEKSEISVIRNGVKFIYSRRILRIKKNTIEDLLKVLRTDERLNGCYNILESQIAVVMNAKTSIEGKTRKII